MEITKANPTLTLEHLDLVETAAPNTLLSFLEINDIQALACVSKNLCLITVRLTHHYAIFCIEKMISSTNQSMTDAQTEIWNGIKILYQATSRKLFLLQSDLPAVEHLAYRLFMSLEPEIQCRLEATPLSCFVTNPPPRSPYPRKPLSVSDEPQVFSSISSKLANLGEISHAIQFTNKISNRFQKSQSLEAIIPHLTNTEDISLVLEMMRSTIDQKDSLLAAIIPKLTTGEHISPVIEMIRALKSSYMKDSLLLAIADKSATLGVIPQAIESVRGISLLSNSLKILQNIIAHITTLADLERMSDIAKTSPLYEFEKDQLLANIASKFAAFGEVEQAIKVTDAIKNKDAKLRGQQSIVSKLAQLRELPRAIEMASSAPTRLYQCSLFNAIFSHLTTAEDMEIAYRSITREELREDPHLLLYPLCLALLKIGEIDKAVEQAKKTAIPSIRNKILKEAADQLEKRGQPESAGEVRAHIIL
ncbi:MAG: hypothetical protein KBC64_00965 [Simkaniaceae bacterium]|nr:hypothetical protein [Simkaniaceae bacterium]